jgi:hypothetical protein
MPIKILCLIRFQEISQGYWCDIHNQKAGQAGLEVISTLPAVKIAAGDIVGDSRDDLVGLWNSFFGYILLVRDSDTGEWINISMPFPGSYPENLATGDINGDGKDDIILSYTFGVYWRNSASPYAWTQITSSHATKIASGDINGLDKDDLIFTLAGQSGVYVIYSEDSTQAQLFNRTPVSFDAGMMRNPGYYEGESAPPAEDPPEAEYGLISNPTLTYYLYSYDNKLLAEYDQSYNFSPPPHFPGDIVFCASDFVT